MSAGILHLVELVGSVRKDGGGQSWNINEANEGEEISQLHMNSFHLFN